MFTITMYAYGEPFKTLVAYTIEEALEHIARAGLPTEPPYRKYPFRVEIDDNVNQVNNLLAPSHVVFDVDVLNAIALGTTTRLKNVVITPEEYAVFAGEWEEYIFKGTEDGFFWDNQLISADSPLGRLLLLAGYKVE